MITLILAVERSMKLMMTLNLCLINLKKILDINYTYGSLAQLIAKDILWRVIIILFPIEWVIEGGYSRQNEDDQKGKNLATRPTRSIR